MDLGLCPSPTPRPHLLGCCSLLVLFVLKPQDALLRQYKEEIERLQKILEAQVRIVLRFAAAVAPAALLVCASPCWAAL